MDRREVEIHSRELGPEELAIRKEEELGSTLPHELEMSDVELLKKVRLEMRREKPHYFAIFSTLLKAMHRGGVDIRTEVRPEGQLQFHVHAYHGFQAEHARKFAISANTVKYRMLASLEWFVRRSRWHLAKREGQS